MSYAVVWNENDGPVYAGQLELAGRAAELSGVARGTREARRKLFYEELAGASIERRRGSRLAGLPTLALDLRAGGRFRIASLQGAGSLPELAELLQERCRTAAA